MKTVISAALLGLVAANQEAFMEHITHYNLSYGTRAEFEFRFVQYMQVDAKINELNASPEHELATFGHNNFSTWTEQERSRLLGTLQLDEDNMQEPHDFGEPNAWYQFDWMQRGAVTRVQQQGCGDCWAFGATAALEGNYQVKTGKFVKFAEQHLVDCVIPTGCSGGWDDWAYDYLQSHKFMRESDYPYVGKDQKCAYNSSKGVFKTTGWWQVPQNKPGQLYGALSLGVLSAEVKAGQDAFFQYQGGILDANCPGVGDHIVAIVGYGVRSGREFWVIKNSWGTGWGENGYARLAKDEEYGSACVQRLAKKPTL